MSTALISIEIFPSVPPSRISLNAARSPSPISASACENSRTPFGYLAAKSGITRIAATPHSYVDKGDFLSFREKVDQTYNFVKGVIQHEKIPVDLLLGTELLVTSDFDDRLHDGNYITLNGSNNLLIEFMFEESFEYMERAISKITDKGLTPVIAHPERYVEIQSDPERMGEWTRSGCVLQLNKGSFIGFFGDDSKKCAVHLLKNGYAQVIASDAHSATSRTPYLMNIEEFLNGYFGREYSEILLKKNPDALLDGGELTKIEALNNG